MKSRGRITAFLRKYKHAWVFLYALIYMPWFTWLENTVTGNYYVIYSPIDDRIPFVEYFIVPYLLWFVYMAVGGLYFFFKDVDEFYKLAKVMITGMTLFLVLSTIVPNGLNLRPEVFARDNIFVDLVRFVYRVDTPTNVFPSLHVFNSLAISMAVYESKSLKGHKNIRIATYVMAGLIILSTMFLKQHSVLDVIMAFVLAYVLHQCVYVQEEHRVFRMVRNRRVLLQNIK